MIIVKAPADILTYMWNCAVHNVQYLRRLFTNWREGRKEELFQSKVMIPIDCEQNDAALLTSLEALLRGYEIFNSHDYLNKVGWRRANSQEGVSIHTKRMNCWMLVSIEAEIEIPAQVLYDFIWTTTTDFQSTLTMVRHKAVRAIGANADLAWYSEKNNKSGLNESLYLRARLMMATCYMIARKSVDINKRMLLTAIRKETNISATRITRHPNNAEHSVYQHIVSFDMEKEPYKDYTEEKVLKGIRNNMMKFIFTAEQQQYSYH